MYKVMRKILEIAFLLLLITHLSYSRDSCRMDVIIDTIGGEIKFFDQDNDSVITYRFSEQKPAFHKGMIAVYDRGGIGCVDSCGRVVVPLRYKYVSLHSETYIPVMKSLKEGIYFDENGNEVFRVPSFARDFHLGLAVSRRGTKYGYIDTQGNLVIPSIYDSADDFYYDGLARVTLKDKHYCLNVEGNVFTYEDILSDDEKIKIYNLVLNASQFDNECGEKLILYANKQFLPHGKRTAIYCHGERTRLKRRRTNVMRVKSRENSSRNKAMINYICTDTKSSSEVYVNIEFNNQFGNNTYSVLLKKNRGEWQIINILKL